MHIGILETGAPPGDLSEQHGDYAGMVARLLGPGHLYTRYDVRAGGLPGDPGECDAYVVTGSAAGVNDGLPWTGSLAAFLRAARGRARLIGICFGHQAIAHAFGGRVDRLHPLCRTAYPHGEALTLQFHPEFDAAYGRALIGAHAAPDIDDALRSRALGSMAAPGDNAAIGDWLNRYLATGSID